MAKHLTFPGIYLTNADTGKRESVQAFEPGDALVAAPQPIVGYAYLEDGLTVYVNGSMPLAMRSAQEQGCTECEAWLVEQLPAGIQEITLADHRQEFRLKKAA